MSDEIDNSNNQLLDLVDAILATAKKSTENRLPCRVTQVISRTKVNVRPLIKIVTQDESLHERNIIEGLPVFTPGAGDMFISFPVAVGDLGWIEACDRDISLFLQTYDNVEPPTNRMHSFSDAKFVPDMMTNITIAEEDAAAIVIQDRNGTVKIAVDDGQIRVCNDSVTVNITGDSVTGVAPGGFNLNGFTIDASGAAASPVSVSAPSVSADSSLTVAGKEQKDHTHAPGTFTAGGDTVKGISGVQI